MILSCRYLTCLDATKPGNTGKMDLTQEMTSDDDFGRHMEQVDKSSLVIVLYFIKDSSSSTQIQPIFRQMSFKFQSKDVHFFKVDADLCRSTVQKHKIHVMPTFVLYRNMEPLQVIQGAQPLQLETAIRQELSKSGHTPVDVLNAEDVGFSMGPGGLGDLYHFIDPKRSECLNCSDLTPFHDFINRKCKLESDCDEQLILVYGFNQPVKIKSVKIKAPLQNGPKSLKLFINQVSSMDFDDVNQFKPTQEIMLEKSDLEGDRSIQLNQSRFHNVTNLHIFIPGNLTSCEVTEVNWLSLYGDPMTPKKGTGGTRDQVVFLD